MNLLVLFLMLPYEGKTFKGSLCSYEYYGYDVLKYDISLYLPLTSSYLEGTVTIDMEAKQSLDTIKIMLCYTMLCEEITINGNPVDFLHNTNNLIKIPYSVSSGETLSVAIKYHGYAPAGYFFVDSDNEKEITGYTFTEPWNSRYWFPCYDHPSDKSLSEMRIEVPEGFVVASNGVLVGTDVTDSTVIYHWKEDEPIVTYLMSLAVAPYTVIDTFYVSITGDTIDIVYYLYEGDVSAGLELYKNLFYMLEFFENKFGPYPFTKYGMTEVPAFFGGMEHQTITTLSRETIDNKWEDVVVHEFAHQWWGDMVTLQDWPEIWLNEGFATYSEALFEEYFYGEEYFQSLMSKRKQDYFKENKGPIYDPPISYLFSWGTIYCKGSWVLHMLRGIVGDSIFFDILHTYGERYKYKNATTEDFKDVVEDVYGEDMDWFFDEWIYGKDHPVYDTILTVRDDSLLMTIEQVQGEDNLFKMPIEIMVVSSDTSITYLIWDSLQTQTFSFYFPYEIEEVVFDPDSIVLKEMKPAGILEGNDFAVKYLSKGVNITLGGQEDIDIYDVNGRVVRHYNDIADIFIKYSDFKRGIYFVKRENKRNIKIVIF